MLKLLLYTPVVSLSLSSVKTEITIYNFRVYMQFGTDVQHMRYLQAERGMIALTEHETGLRAYVQLLRPTLPVGRKQAQNVKA